MNKMIFDTQKIAKQGEQSQRDNIMMKNYAWSH